MPGLTKGTKEVLLRSLVGPLLVSVIACGKGASNQSPSGQNALEAAAYRSKIAVSKVGLVKGENYLGSEVFYVEGSLKNTGDRVVKRV